MRERLYRALWSYQEDRDELIRRLAAAGHRKIDIAHAVGLSPQAISKITSDYTKCSENPIKSTSAAEELEARRTNADKKHAVRMAFQQLMEDGRNIRDVDDVSHTEVARMAAVHRQYVSSVRGDIERELLGDVRIGQPPTITPKSKQTSSDDTQRLKDELSSMQPVARQRTPISRRPQCFT